MRYFEDRDDETGVTPSRLKRMSEARQWPYVRHWFMRMFEDPANETPRAEGEFQYVWGGPYDALEQLQEEFPDLPFDRAERFARRLEERGGVVDWAPGPDHPDHRRAAEDYEREHGQPEEEADLEALIQILENGAVTNFGEAHEIRERAEVLKRLAHLEALLTDMANPSGGAPGLGHNNPPPDPPSPLPPITINIAVFKEARAATAAIRDELVKPTPDALVVAKQTSLIKKILVGARAFTGAMVTAAAAGIVGGVAKQIAEKHPELSIAADAFITQATHWLLGVMSPF